MLFHRKLRKGSVNITFKPHKHKLYILRHCPDIVYIHLYLIPCKKSLKMPKWKSESVNRRRSDNTKEKEQTAIYKTLRRKVMIEQHEPDQKLGWTHCFGRVSSSCSTTGTRCVTFIINLVIGHEWGKDQIVIRTNAGVKLTILHQRRVWIYQRVNQNP